MHEIKIPILWSKHEITNKIAGIIFCFPKKFKELKISKNRRIGMFCTGGIRCEKASAYLKKQGYKNVFQLDGGILNYLRTQKNNSEDQYWHGECFVFDDRVTVNKNLEKGKFLQCYGCRMPIKTEDTKSNKYIKGVSCPHCYDLRSKEQKKKISYKTNSNLLC